MVPMQSRKYDTESEYSHRLQVGILKKDERLQHYHAWRLWSISVPVDAEGWLEFCVRTWDSSNNTEPTYVRSAWKSVYNL